MADAAALGAEPMPASLENSPRLKPLRIAAPMPPAAASCRPKALCTISDSTPGNSSRLIRMMPIAISR
ncbi:hypothetical protein D9M71_668520 [compost metagenome]